MDYAVVKKEGEAPGLKFLPSVEPSVSDDADSIPIMFQRVHPPREFTDDNQRVLRDSLLKMDSPKVIVEIGVQRNPLPDSSTGILLDNKDDSTIYIGIDIEDKSVLNNKEKNIYTIKGSSSDRETLYKLMEELGVKEIDFFFIDGWHSINQCIEDWRITEKLSSNGVVVMHDTNHHPGPVGLFEAIDENLYDKKKYCEGWTDWGIAVAKRKA